MDKSVLAVEIIRFALHNTRDELSEIVDDGVENSLILRSRKPVLIKESRIDIPSDLAQHMESE